MPGKAKTSKSRSSAGSKRTVDHEEIRAWAEARGGQPACVKGTGGKGDTGLLRIDFPGYGGEQSLQQIEWEEFFEKFDQQKLALLYQDRTRDGEESRFNKLVRRTSAARGGSAAKTSPSKAGAKSHPGARTRERASEKSASRTRAPSRSAGKKSGRK